MDHPSIPIVRPSLPPFEEIEAELRQIWGSGRITLGPFTERFEQRICASQGVAHAVAVSSCTSGLMLVWRALGLTGEVIVPSFTFTATVEAFLWNGLTPVFADCLPGTGTIDPEAVERAIGPRTAAICPVTIFGLPPDIDAIESIAGARGIPVVYDTAQGAGALFHGRPLGGFGVAEVFSLSPTKVVTAMEGGVVTTNDAALAAKARSLRDYGKVDGGKDYFAAGLSARMPEVCAAVAVRNLDALETARLRREKIAARYREGLGDLPGIAFQEMPPDRRSGLNYFVILVGPDAPVEREALAAGLDAAGIQTKPYFHPPVHQQSYLAGRCVAPAEGLPRTDRWAAASLALPLFNAMADSEVETVIAAVRRGWR
jgi:dTDP-4-amino-4,6-dideoxygalactose transaminase